MYSKQLSKDVNKEIKNCDISLPPQPECVVCATTNPETSFIHTKRTKMGTSLLVFVQKVIKPGWKPKGNFLGSLTICKPCMDSVNYLEDAQMKANAYESSDSDSDEWRKNAKLEIPNKSFISINQTAGPDAKHGEDRKEANAEDPVPDNTESDQRTEVNTTHECQNCNLTYLRYSFGRDALKENRSNEPLDCIICQRLFTFRRCRRRKQLTTKKPFGCNICKCRFMWEESLWKHLKSHTRQIPFQCHACELKFDKRPELLSHSPKCKPCVCGIKCFQVMETD